MKNPWEIDLTNSGNKEVVMNIIVRDYENGPTAWKTEHFYTSNVACMARVNSNTPKYFTGHFLTDCTTKIK